MRAGIRRSGCGAHFQCSDDGIPQRSGPEAGASDEEGAITRVVPLVVEEFQHLTPVSVPEMGRVEAQEQPEQQVNHLS